MSVSILKSARAETVVSGNPESFAAAFSRATTLHPPWRAFGDPVRRRSGRYGLNMCSSQERLAAFGNMFQVSREPRPDGARTSDEVGGSQGSIGVDDLPQFFLARAIPAVGVGMVALDQVLVAG